jgi:membrane protein YqaA with SNARE-associated domain
MANPRQAWRLATLTTVTSVLGGLAGYAIGVFAFDLIQPLMAEGSRYQTAFAQAKEWFDEWGAWAVFIAGFSPIPYKVFTIAAGVLSMALLPFTLASLVGRGGRFFLVAALMAWGGERMEATLRTYVDRLGWVMLLLIAAVVVWSR